MLGFGLRHVLCFENLLNIANLVDIKASAGGCKAYGILSALVPKNLSKHAFRYTKILFELLNEVFNFFANNENIINIY